MLQTNTSVCNRKCLLLIFVYTFMCVLCKADDISNDLSSNEHQNYILSGVTKILRTVTPGTMSLINEKAFPILAGDNGQILRPHIAGSEYGAGRIIAYSHSSFYLTDNLPTGNDNIRLFINCMDWVQKSPGWKVGAKVEKAAENIMRQYGLDVEVLSVSNLSNLTLLEQFDFLAIGYFDVSIVNYESIRTYVRNGGGLIINATPWAGSDFNNMESYWANIVLKDTGIFYIGRYYAYGTTDCGGACFNASVEYLRDTNAFQVWNDFKQYNSNQTHLPLDRLRQMMQILDDRLRDGPNNANLNNEINTELKRIPTFVPTAANPVTEEYQKYFLIVHRYLCVFLNYVGLTSDIPPHPSAVAFPGTSTVSTNQRMTYLIEIDASLPSWSENMSLDELQNLVPNENIVFDEADDIEQILDTIEIDATRTYWHSSGLYALPGEEIQIKVLNADASISDLEVQVGAHTDNIQHLASWTRCPQIVFRNRIINDVATIANPFGGSIYIISPTFRNISLQVSVEGGIRSPSFFFGKANLQQWRNEIRNSPAPWGELIGKNLIISAQKSVISQLNNPEEVIDLWDRIMDAIADLAAIPRERIRAERFVPDVLISGGWLHSGYPIMYYLSVQANPTNFAVMTQEQSKMWGFLHELGHNHQKSDWTFTGTGEVTCNLFALYVMHVVLYCPTNKTHSDLSDVNVASRLRQFTQNGKQFSQWQSSPFLALDTYIQLQETFGWSAYRSVFANYHLLTENERPNNDQQKIDLWMIMFSRVVQQNLAPFFISWGFPITAEGEAVVRHLPSTTLRIPQST